MQKVIIFNHMFTGNFLNKNIGHEVINLFADDKGDNYIYLCKDGAYNRKDIDIANSLVVQVQRPSKTINTLEIISVAAGLSLVDNNFTEDNFEPTYGLVPISEIFANNIQKQDRYLTFKAKNIYTPNEPIYVYYGSSNENESDVYLSNIYDADDIFTDIVSISQNSWDVSTLGASTTLAISSNFSRLLAK